MNNFERRTIAEQSSQSVNQTNQAENPQKGRHGLGNKDEAPRKKEEERQENKKMLQSVSRICWKSSQCPE